MTKPKPTPGIPLWGNAIGWVLGWLIDHLFICLFSNNLFLLRIMNFKLRF